MEQTQPRTTYLDALRILACLGVVYNHVAGQSMRLFEGAFGAAALFGFFLSKGAVPLFLLVSGAVLLGRCDSIRKSAVRLIRIVLALTLFSLLYFGLDCWLAGRAFSLSAFGWGLLQGKIAVSYWYLYLYIGVLLAMPLLQRLSARMTRTDYRYFILWALLFSGVAPTVAARWPALQLSNSFQLVLFPVSLGLVMLGRYGDESIEMNGRRALAAALAIPILGAIPTALATANSSWFGLLDNYYLPFATGGAACVFLIAKWLDARVLQGARVRRMISGIGRLTFCTYLISDPLMIGLGRVREAIVPLAGTNGAGLIYVAIVFSAGLTISAALTRIPGLRKLI